MRNAVAYVRVSTEGQIEKYGIDAQKKDIRDYAAKNGYNILEWFVDEGVSGVTDPVDRPAFGKLVFEVAENPPIEAVIVAATDRIARGEVQYWTAYGLLQDRGVELVSTKEDFQSMGAFAPLIRSILVSLGAIERMNIKTRTMAGRRIKAYSGGYCGGNTPYGYVSSGDGTMAVDPDEAAVVREIFRMKGEGCSLRRISDLLRIRGVVTRSGGDFSPSTIKSILDNRQTYLGYFKYGNMEWTKGQHEAILEGEDDK